MNVKLVNLPAEAKDLARRTTETYSDIAAELAEKQIPFAVKPGVVEQGKSNNNFPIKARLRDQVLYVPGEAPNGLGTREIIQVLREKGDRYGIDIAVHKLPQRLVAMENKLTEIEVERLPNGRKVHYLIRQGKQDEKFGL